MGRHHRGCARASAHAGHRGRGGADDPRRSEGPWHERVLPRSRWDAPRADHVRGLIRNASADPAGELRQRVHELANVVRFETWGAAEHLIALGLPDERKPRRLVDEPRHEPEIEYRSRESAIR